MGTLHSEDTDTFSFGHDTIHRYLPARTKTSSSWHVLLLGLDGIIVMLFQVTDMFAFNGTHIYLMAMTCNSLRGIQLVLLPGQSM